MNGFDKFIRVLFTISLVIMGVFIALMSYILVYSGMQPDGYVMAWWEIPSVMFVLAVFAAAISAICVRNYFVKKYEEEEYYE